MKNADRKVELLKKLQKELDHRTQIENEAVRLIENCEIEKAGDLLQSVDDSIVNQIKEELEKLDAESGKEETEELQECVGMVSHDAINIKIETAGLMKKSDLKELIVEAAEIKKIYPDFEVNIDVAYTFTGRWRKDE